MRTKAWKTDDPDFLSSRPRSPGLLGQPARCIIAVAVIMHLALAQMMARWNPAIAAPPAAGYILVPNSSAIAPRTQVRSPDRFVKAAPTGLDERAVVAARPTIDERIIHNPYSNDGSRTVAVIPVPRARVMKPIAPTPR